MRDHRHVDPDQCIHFRHRERLVGLVHGPIKKAEFDDRTSRAQEARVTGAPVAVGSAGDPTLSPAASRRDRARLAADLSLLIRREEAAVAGHQRLGPLLKCNRTPQLLLLQRRCFVARPKQSPSSAPHAVNGRCGGSIGDGEPSLLRACRR